MKGEGASTGRRSSREGHVEETVREGATLLEVLANIPFHMISMPIVNKRHYFYFLFCTVFFYHHYSDCS